MFNSLAKYIWGSGSELEESSKDAEQGCREQCPETQHEEDWVLVATNAASKEKSEHQGKDLELVHHHGHEDVGDEPTVQGRHDSLSQASASSDVEVLDDAAALAQSLTAADQDQRVTDNYPVRHPCPLHDCGWINPDFDKNSDTDSLPESVFSACSGRSHATYHPHGSHSEPWVVAPPPCFTGSQVGESSHVASSPLENLLIEHPSMSVYLSFPHHTPTLPTQEAGIGSLQGEVTPNIQGEVTPNIQGEVTLSIQEEVTHSIQGETAESEIARQRSIDNEVLNEENPYTVGAVQERNTRVHAAIHPGPVLSQQLFENIRLAQRLNSRRSWKSMGRCQCHRQNKVQEYQAHSKGSNKRNKLAHPSGFMSSRNSHHI